MAQITPFAGLHYNTEKVALADVIAPPYDIIKGRMRSELIARSEYNVVRVELPEGSDDSKYDQAARLLQEWRESGVLVEDSPIYYCYEQEFQVPGTGIRKKRRGVLGALRLEEFGQGVQPHEHTLSGPKQDRLKLLRATRANISPIFGLYDDSDGWATALLNNVCLDPPLVEATDSEGVIHRLWRISDDETVNAVEASLENETLLIADGHHRYETALNYRNECIARAQAQGRDWTGAEPENHVLMMCVATMDEGLIVLPTHRLVKNAGESQIANLPAALAEFFTVEPLAEEGSAALLQAIEGEEKGRLGLRVKGHSYALRLKEDTEYSAALDAARSDAYNALDVSILHRLILERQLGIGAGELAAGEHVAYTIDAAEALRQVDSGEAQAAFLLRATPVEQVQEVAAAGDKMPQKSTYFYPKLMTGLVLRPLDR
jgi:uncharacterized protein (DUF1015 family)